MCLILFRFRPQTEEPLLVAANRDEFHARASAQADFWQDEPHILAGRDLVAGGTWLGCSRQGRFAALTNFTRDPSATFPKSRGALVSDFLAGSQSVKDYALGLKGDDYAGYNLLLFDGSRLLYTTNIAQIGQPRSRLLPAGDYGLSNAELGAPWPKCVDGARRLGELVDGDHTNDQLIEILSNQQQPEDDRLPKRGKPVAAERHLGSCFISDSNYGTRASTVVRMGRKQVYFCEQTYLPDGISGAKVEYTFAPQSL
jgi:uncharacterized protein with NRDE domain